MVVTNSSALIYLAALSDFELLQRLFGDVSMPPAVWTEVVEQGSAFPVHDAVRAAIGKWLRVVPLEAAVQPISIRDHRLHLGETEVIRLAEQSIRLSPRDPVIGIWYMLIGQAQLLQSHTGEALIWLEKARNAMPAHPSLSRRCSTGCHASAGLAPRPAPSHQ